MKISVLTLKKKIVSEKYSRNNYLVIKLRLKKKQN